MGQARLHVLGPLEAWVDDRTVQVPRPKQRALLAVLALDAGRCVSRDRIIEALWGPEPAQSRAHSLQVHVSALRKLLGAALIETCPTGYRLAVPPEAVDAVQAERLLAAGDPEAALALFRGRPLEDVELEGAAAHEQARLDDLRLAALEQRFERELAAGKGAELVGPLERLVAEAPLRERPRAQLMRALYRAGRQADALRAFQDARRTFVDELGLEPSAELRDLERAILQQDGSLAGQAAVSPLEQPPSPPRGRRRRLVWAVALACAATAAGLVAAYLLPPSSPQAAPGTRPTAHRAPVSTRSSSTTTTTKGVRHRAAARRRPAVVRTTVVVAPVTTVRHRAAPRRVAVTTTTPPAPTPPAPTTTRAVARPPASPAPTTTTARVATYPTRTTPAPTTTAPTSGPVRIVDTFDSAIPSSTWNIFVNGTNATAVQKDGKLLLDIGPGAQPGGSYNFVGVQYGSKACYSGNIDMQVDYQLIHWPAGSGAWVGLQAVFANALVERFASQGSSTDVYGSIIDPRFVQANATGTTGSLRLTRVGGIVTTYYLDNGAWQMIDTASAPHPAHLHIGLSIVPATSTASDITVALDNFSATAYGPTTC